MGVLYCKACAAERDLLEWGSWMTGTCVYCKKESYCINAPPSDITIEYKDKEHCSCCGELRPHPTRPGRWQYLQHPDMHRVLSVEQNKPEPWVTVTVKEEFEELGERHLIMIEDGNSGPSWWPDNAAWRKLE